MLERGGGVNVAKKLGFDCQEIIGAKAAFGLEPDLVTGPATNTSAAIDLVRKLTGLHGINIIDPDAMPEFRQYLLRILGLPLTGQPSNYQAMP